MNLLIIFFFFSINCVNKTLINQEKKEFVSKELKENQRENQKNDHDDQKSSATAQLKADQKIENDNDENKEIMPQNLTAEEVVKNNSSENNIYQGDHLNNETSQYSREKSENEETYRQSLEEEVGEAEAEAIRALTNKAKQTRINAENQLIEAKAKEKLEQEIFKLNEKREAKADYEAAQKEMLIEKCFFLLRRNIKNVKITEELKELKEIMRELITRFKIEEFVERKTMLEEEERVRKELKYNEALELEEVKTKQKEEEQKAVRAVIAYHIAKQKRIKAENVSKKKLVEAQGELVEINEGELTPEDQLIEAKAEEELALKELQKVTKTGALRLLKLKEKLELEKKRKAETDLAAAKKQSDEEKAGENKRKENEKLVQQAESAKGKIEKEASKADIVNNNQDIVNNNQTNNSNNSKLVAVVISEKQPSVEVEKILQEADRKQNKTKAVKKSNRNIAIAITIVVIIIFVGLMYLTLFSNSIYFFNKTKKHKIITAGLSSFVLIIILFSSWYFI